MSLTSLTKEYTDIKKIALNYPKIDGLVCRIYNKIEWFEMIELRALPEKKAREFITEVKRFVSEKLSELRNRMELIKKWDKKEFNRISEWMKRVEKFINEL